ADRARRAVRERVFQDDTFSRIDRIVAISDLAQQLRHLFRGHGRRAVEQNFPAAWNGSSHAAQSYTVLIYMRMAALGHDAEPPAIDDSEQILRRRPALPFQGQNSAAPVASS